MGLHLRQWVSLVLLSGFTVLRAVEPATYDVLITHGRVFDGTALISADLAIRGDRIVAVGATLAGTATRVLDASGLVVSPGFIDIHAHVEPLPLDRAAQSAVRQGVTFVLGSPDGGGPVDLVEHLALLESKGIGLNAGFLIGHNSVRMDVMGISNRAPTADELAAMQARIDAAMRAGAFGFSTGLLYLPGTYSDRAEVVALARVAGAAGGIYTTHLRKEGLGLIDGVTEAILIGEEAHIPVVLTHHKAIGTKMWGASKESLALVDAARARGLDVMLDQYPYTASHTSLRVLIPSWALEGDAGGQYAHFAKRLADPEQRAQIRKEIAFNIVNDRGGGDLGRIQFSRFAWKPELAGKTMRDWALAERRDPSIETGVDLVIEAELHGGASCSFHVIAEEDVVRILQHPQTMVASDGRLSQPGKDHPHPRAYGTFPRVLGVYVREKKVVTLEQALSKMTTLPAQRLGLTDRGTLAVGAFADVVVFNPDTIVDRSTFEDPHQYPEGIAYVLVNGQVTVDADGYHDRRAGRVVRRPTATVPTPLPSGSVR